MDQWEFAGWGRSTKLTHLEPPALDKRALHHSQLGTWASTAICGNDIASSVLYVSSLSILAAGVYAPIALLGVAALLFAFRKIYGEVGSALPLNGGTYTVLLNTTNKRAAAGAAVLTLLSYIATAVISAGEAMHYAEHLWSGLNVPVATVTLLSFFALLNILGISESAKVALVIFFTHLVTLTLLVCFGAYTVLSSPDVLLQNFEVPTPDGRSVGKALVLGFSAALLGISGFESSANFIEEQKPGVFPKTLRNMWITVSIFNPLICFLALGLVPQTEVAENQESLLALMGLRAGGSWLSTLVSIDAVLVLSGAVLTSFVGVSGLARRMSLDRCLPQFFLSTNRWRGTNHWIILAFLGACVAILAITKMHVGVLAGVYTLSFLGVMALFCIGNLMLKKERGRLPRDERARPGVVVLALIFVLIGLGGHLSGDNLRVFSLFFFSMGLLVLVMFIRVQLLEVLFYGSQNLFSRMLNIDHKLARWIQSRIDAIHAQSMVYFTRGDNLVSLNKAALYVLDNEQTTHLRVIHVYEDESLIPPTLQEQLKTIDHLYPQLRIDFIAVKGKFGPELIDSLSRTLKIPKNYMFIGTPGDRFPHQIESLGGVRLIL